jgi:hypothetical protein
VGEVAYLRALDTLFVPAEAAARWLDSCEERLLKRKGTRR